MECLCLAKEEDAVKQQRVSEEIQSLTRDT